MTVTEWVETEKKNLEKFAAYWLRQESEAPGQFPHDMRWGEWWEQYETFDGSSETGGEKP